MDTGWVLETRKSGHPEVPRTRLFATLAPRASAPAGNQARTRVAQISQLVSGTSLFTAGRRQVPRCLRTLFHPCEQGVGIACLLTE